MGALISLALQKIGAKSVEEPRGLAGQAIGLALNMDPDMASGLSPQTLVSLFGLSNADDRVIALVGQAIEIEAAALEDRGDVVAAGFRRQQAEAVRSLLETESRVVVNRIPGEVGE